MRLAFVGTGLAPIEPSSGALERSVLAWADGAASAGAESVLVHATDHEEALEQARASKADLVVLNNRPLWAEGLTQPVIHILHNYSDAWAISPEDRSRVQVELSRGVVAAVSASLGRHVEESFRLASPVKEVRIAVEECFFSQSWHGCRGPVVFPNRLLEKKGVRLFLDIADALRESGRRCLMFRHIAPWSRPTAEQRELLALIAERGSVELCPAPSSRQEMAGSLAVAGVVLCPSVAPEGLGLVALEAQAVGAPVVTSGLGGLGDATFTPNETVGSADPAAWCAAIERADSRPPSPLPRARILERHGTGAAVKSFLDLLGTASNPG